MRSMRLPSGLSQILFDLSRKKWEQNSMKTVYMSFSTDVIHGGHIKIINEAAKLGSIVAGVLPNEVIASYGRQPLTSQEERMEVLQCVKGIDRVIKQNTISYAQVLEQLRPDYVVHGDDWQTGVMKPIRQEVIDILSQQGGQLVEFPYTHNETLDRLKIHLRGQSGLPDVRRPRLKNMLKKINRPLRFIEAHNGLSGLICENTSVFYRGEAHSFDGMWLSSLCYSTIKGKPDIELVDLTSRMKTVDEIMEVTTKPIIFDGDTGGQIEHFVHNIQTLERNGISATIIEDKIGLKKNSLFGVDAEQAQDSIPHFCKKISEGKKALKTQEFMLIARIESLILEVGMEDALSRAFAYVGSGADGIMIHSKQKEPDEVLEFCNRFREKDIKTPIVVVPTTFDTLTEEELAQHGVNVIIYANQLIRSAYPAMKAAAESILVNRRAKEASEQYCMPIKTILTLIDS